MKCLKSRDVVSSRRTSPRWIAFSALAILLCFPVVAQNTGRDEQPAFPTESEITLLVTQSERAVETYESAIKLEEAILGIESGAKSDREALGVAYQVLLKLKATPNLFSSPLGFLLITTLDDASRNMAVCMGQAGMSASTDAIDKNLATADRKLLLTQTCMDASALLYTVSESAVALYQNYMLANAQLQNKTMEVSNRCVDALKKHGAIGKR